MQWHKQEFKTEDKAQAAAEKLDAAVKAIHQTDDGWVLEWTGAEYNPAEPADDHQEDAEPVDAEPGDADKFDEGGMYSE